MNPTNFLFYIFQTVIYSHLQSFTVIYSHSQPIKNES